MKEKPNCKNYDNCVGCPYLKIITATIEDVDGKFNEEELAICEYNRTVDEIFGLNGEDN